MESAHRITVWPLESEETDAGGDHTVQVTVQDRMDQQVTGPGSDPANIASLFENAAQYDSGIRMEMPMPGHVKVGWKILLP
jgi:hypothetical protein